MALLPLSHDTMASDIHLTEAPGLCCDLAKRPHYNDSIARGRKNRNTKMFRSVNYSDLPRIDDIDGWWFQRWLLCSISYMG